LLGSGSSLPVLLSNPTKKPVSIASIITTGNFSVAASPCGLTLAAGGQCTFYVVFSPAAAGAQTGMLSVNDDANNTPQKVKLSGAGVAAPPVLVSISVAPASATLKKGAWLQLTATGTYSDHSTSNLTVASQWSSLSPAVATVGSSGLVSAVGPGTATILALSGSVSASSTITVPQPVPVTETIVPGSFFLSLGTPLQFSCQVTYDDGSTASQTSSLTWASSAPSVCSVDGGLAACGGFGTTTITANLCGNASARLDSPINGPRNDMSSARYRHTATLLADGRALIAGGIGPSGPSMAGADLFDPIARTFSPTGGMTSPRSNHTATLLGNGQVLIAGGSSDTSELASAELYNPATGLFTPTGSLNWPRQGHTATLLPNGTVLIAGGDELTAELYDPAAGAFTPAGSLSVQRYKGTATLLGTGQVLVTGGTGIVSVPTAEIFDPGTGAFLGTGSMSAARAFHSAVLLANGTVFIAGGYDGTITLSSTEIYDPATGIFAPAGAMSTARNTHTATVLPSGKVLVSGGENQTGYLATGEMFDPAAGAFVMPGILGMAHYPGPGVDHTALLLGTGQVLIAGGFFRGVTLLGSELFLPQQ
jgi:hypothetical protein